MTDLHLNSVWPLPPLKSREGSEGRIHHNITLSEGLELPLQKAHKNKYTEMAKSYELQSSDWDTKAGFKPSGVTENKPCLTLNIYIL